MPLIISNARLRSETPRLDRLLLYDPKIVVAGRKWRSTRNGSRKFLLYSWYFDRFADDNGREEARVRRTGIPYNEVPFASPANWTEQPFELWEEP